MDRYLLDRFIDTYKFEDSSRIDGNIHVSDLLEFCSRKFALCLKNKINFHTQKYFPTATKFTFEIGNAVQSIVTKRYKKSGILVGTWKCLGCKTKFFGIHGNCPECGRNDLLVYKDTTLILNKYGVPIVGNVDALFLKTQSIIAPLEIKSIKPDSFVELTEPELLHIRQISLYLWLLKSGAKVACNKSNIDMSKYKIHTESGAVHYCCKTQKPMPFKIFKVIPDPELINKIEDKLLIFKSFIDNKKIPKPICNSKSNLMARDCRVRDLCFKNRKG